MGIHVVLTLSFSVYTAKRDFKSVDVIIMFVCVCVRVCVFIVFSCKKKKTQPLDALGLLFAFVVASTPGEALEVVLPRRSSPQRCKLTTPVACSASRLRRRKSTRTSVRWFVATIERRPRTVISRVFSDTFYSTYYAWTDGSVGHEVHKNKCQILRGSYPRED